MNHIILYILIGALLTSGLIALSGCSDSSEVDLSNYAAGNWVVRDGYHNYEQFTLEN